MSKLTENSINSCQGMDDLKIRKATANDSEFAYQTIKAAFKEYLEMVGGWNEEEQRRLHERRFAEYDFRVIQLSGKDVGIMSLSRQPDCIKLNQLFILPDYQSRGIGTACMRFVTEEADASKFPIRLQVLKVNYRAIKFYQRFGFRSTGESDTHILMEKLP